ncbi:MAG: universal stress protein [Dehalococcoidia bacterium]|nr:universal stress protein [Dehalococcoidia bacterium]
MYERVVVPLDGSEIAEAVLPHVAPFAERFGAEIVLVHVAKAFEEVSGETLPPGSIAIPDVSNVDIDASAGQHESEDAAAYLMRIASSLLARGFKVSTELGEGPAPAAAIIAIALDRDCDLIAMSTHGRSGLGRAVFGSVADDVLRNSSLPLLLIRSG